MWNCGPLIPLSPVDAGGDTAADVVSVGEELMVDLDRPVSGLGSRELVAALKQAEREYRRTYARILELTGQAQQRGVYLELGYATLPTFLRDVVRVSRGEARHRLQHSELLTTVAGQAVRAGIIGNEHLAAIATMLQAIPADVPSEVREIAEHTLVTEAGTQDPAAVTKHAQQMLTRIDQDGREPDVRELREPARRLYTRTRSNGAVVFHGQLDAEAGALFNAVLSPLAKRRPSTPEGPDSRTVAERHGDALVEVLRLAADSRELPSEGKELPHVTVTVPFEVLQRNAGTAMLEGIGPIDAESARRICCDAQIIPMVLGSHSEPLDVGRAARTAPTALRRAVVERDRGCTRPGCDRAAKHCDVHHIIHWVDGGPTSLTNSALLCEADHRLVHHSDWTIQLVDGRVYWTPPKWLDPTQTPRRNTLHHTINSG